jgi:hypothetical protein
MQPRMKTVGAGAGPGQGGGQPFQHVPEVLVAFLHPNGEQLPRLADQVERLVTFRVAPRPAGAVLHQICQPLANTLEFRKTK